MCMLLDTLLVCVLSLYICTFSYNMDMDNFIVVVNDINCQRCECVLDFK